eukprot:SAG11_NODE_11717_length_742_cov_1.267496_2_plen_21_part_01
MGAMLSPGAPAASLAARVCAR